MSAQPVAPARTTPPRPTPAGWAPTDIKCRCGDLWSHPAAQMLLGPALRPGGVDLTRTLLAEFGPAAGAVAVDVGCGPGATIELLAQAGYRPIGLDYSARSAQLTADVAPAACGDAERLPLRDGSTDLVLLECVVSTLPDKAPAIREARRVLRPGGQVFLTDMTLTESFPEPLNTALAWVACAGGALGTVGYVDLLRDSGFEIRSVTDHSGDVATMVSRARRRLALFRGAAAVGLVPPLDEFIGTDLAALAVDVLGHDDLDLGAKQMLTQVAGAVETGALGYTAIVATRR